MIVSARWVVLLLVAALAGCGEQMAAVKDTTVGWFKDDEDEKKAAKLKPAELAKDFEPSITVDELWSGRFGKGSEKLYLKLLPAPYQEFVYTADRDGRMLAVAAATGKVVWEERDKKRLISGGPGVGEGKVYVGTSEAQVLARDAKTGEKAWVADVSSEVLAPPRAADGFVIVRTGDGKIYALDASTGHERWVFDRTVPVLTLRGTAAPVIHAGRVIAGFDNGRLVALDLASGRQIWETRLGEPSGRSDLERLVDIDGEPVVRGNTAYIASFQGRVAAISIDDGTIEWTRDISSYADLAVDEAHVYVTDEKGTVWALERGTGNSVWRQRGLKYRQLTGPAHFRNYVVVGDFEGYLHWLDDATGKIVYRARIDKSRILATPIDLGGALLGYGSSGELAAYQVR